LEKVSGGGLGRNLTSPERNCNLVLKNDIETAMGPGSSFITTSPSEFVCTFIPRISLVCIDVDKFGLQRLDSVCDSINKTSVLDTIAFESDSMVT
jgi:hypothetical protein